MSLKIEDLSYSNHYKSKVTDTGKKKKKEKGESKTPLLSGNAFEKVQVFLKDDRTRNILGLFLFLVCGVLLLSLTSYLFTWQVDQDNVAKDQALMDILTNSEVDFENWVGGFGAWLSHHMIYNGFGISSFVFVLLTFLLGFRVLFKVNLLPFWKTTSYSLFALIWLSAFFGAIFPDSLSFMGGTFGHAIYAWLSVVIGTIGTFALILFAGLVFAIVNFNLTIGSVMNLFKTDENDPATSESSMAAEEGTEEVTADETSSEVSFDEEEPEATKEEATEEDEDDGLSLEMETTAPKDAPEKPVENDDLELETSAPQEEKKEVEEKTPEAESESEDGVAFDVEEGTGDEELSEEEKKPEEMADYDPLLDLSKYQHPPIDMLADHGDGNIQVEREELEHNKNRIVETLKNYNIGISKIKATIGPTVTLYEIVPEAGVRISKIKNLEDDIALSLAALGIRIIAPIPGKGTIGIEVPNQTPDVVSMRTVIQSDKFQHSKMELPVALGKTISNETFVTDLAKMPHLLMAGATGQGKSVGLNAILASLLYKKHPAQVKFVLVDPKKVELTLFNKIERHFLAKLPDEEEAIITDTSKVVATLNSLCIEMDDRYEMLKNAQCRNIKEYNAKFIKRKLNPNNGHRYLPYIVLVVDEFADLIMTAGKEVELPIARLAQLARAIGIHLIIATQRPSVNIITGTIKANFPSRIAFRVTSKIDSRTILDAGGAEQLIGRGDMLFSNGNDLIRLQCAFIDTPEVEEVVTFIGDQQGYSDAHLLPEYVGESAEGGGGSLDEMDRDAMFEDAARVVVTNQQGSASLLQRKLKLGYNRAGRIVDQLEAAGIIGPFEGSKARQVLIPDEISLEQHLKALDQKNEA